MKLSGPGFFFIGRFPITDSLSLVISYVQILFFHVLVLVGYMILSICVFFNNKTIF